MASILHHVVETEICSKGHIVWTRVLEREHRDSIFTRLTIYFMIKSWKTVWKQLWIKDNALAQIVAAN